MRNALARWALLSGPIVRTVLAMAKTERLFFRVHADKKQAYQELAKASGFETLTQLVIHLLETALSAHRAAAAEAKAAKQKRKKGNSIDER